MGCSNSTMQQAATPRTNMPLEREKTGFVAFKIDLENETSAEMNKDIDKIFAKPLPKRLQNLDPIDDAPKLTADELARKLEKADEKRKKALEKRLQFTRRSSARRRSTITGDENEGNLISQPDLEEMRRREREEQMKQRQREKKAAMVRQQQQQQHQQQRSEIMHLESAIRHVEDDVGNASDDSSAFKLNNRPERKLSINAAESSGYSSRNISASDEKKVLSIEPVSKKVKSIVSDSEDEFFDNHKTETNTKNNNQKTAQSEDDDEFF